jgi:spermidine/putrescine transport system substrate-binding protein
MNALYPTKPLFHIVLLLLGMMSSVAFTAPAAQELVLLNWSEYLDPELVEKFEKKSGVKVREVYFESDDLRDDMMLETGGKGLDLVIVNGVAVETYSKNGWLAKIDSPKIPNLRHINTRWRDGHPGAHEYAVPYFWGTMGLAYRADLIKKPTSWMDILQPDKSLDGKIGMVESAREVMGLALIALGHSTNSSDAAEIKAAEKLLLAQKPFIKDYAYVALGEESALVSGEVVMAMVYSGDALMVQEHNEEINYVVPKEGSIIWVDYLAVLESSNKKELAWDFINFLNEPENAAQLAEFVYYATPNKAAEKLLPEEFLQNKVIYPGAALLEKSEFYKLLPPRAEKQRQSAFARITR